MLRSKEGESKTCFSTRDNGDGERERARSRPRIQRVNLENQDRKKERGKSLGLALHFTSLKPPTKRENKGIVVCAIAFLTATAGNNDVNASATPTSQNKGSRLTVGDAVRHGGRCRRGAALVRKRRSGWRRLGRRSAQHTEKRGTSALLHFLFLWVVERRSKEERTCAKAGQ